MKYYEAAMQIMIIARLSWAHHFSLFYQIMGSGSAIQIQMDRGAAVFVSRGNGQLSGVVKTNCVINSLFALVSREKNLDDCDCR